MVPNVPIPFTGFCFFVLSRWVYIVRDVDFSEWFSNFPTYFFREAKLGLNLVPIAKYRGN